MSERVLGSVSRLQVQRLPLKEKGVRYDPTPIVAVDEAAVGPAGVVGNLDGSWVVDVHHAAHPSSRAGGRRALSIGFEGHYAEMAVRFAAVPVGIAGENIIVDTGNRVGLGDLAGTVVIEGPDGELELPGARVATPCLEFTSYLRGASEVLDRAVLIDDLEFLDGGTRGFILDVSGLAHPMRVRVGDPVVVRS
jgi:hypothetical protein